MLKLHLAANTRAERATTIDTTSAGGNASLLSLEEMAGA